MFDDYKKKKPKKKRKKKKKHEERKQSEIEAIMIHKKEKGIWHILFIATANKSNSFKKKKL